MRLRVRPEAEVDILDAAEWYEKRGPGLGAEFVAEIDAVFGRSLKGPIASAVPKATSAWRSVIAFRMRSTACPRATLSSSSPSFINAVTAIS